MMKWNRRNATIAGVALILVVNLIVLLGVASNHAGPPESVLVLSQRELELPYGWQQSKDNTGISLQMRWRFPGSPSRYLLDSPGWLDKAKLAALGFDVSMPLPVERRRFTRQRPKPVFLVLEFDGPAYRQAIASAAEEEEQALKKGERAGNASPAPLSRELNMNSRLFVVDAGVNREQLRAAYPDRRHYAIVHGAVEPVTFGSGPEKMSGEVKVLSAQSINVPLEFRNVFEPMQARIAKSGHPYSTDLPPFEATVAFGQRLEPWIAAAAAK